MLKEGSSLFLHLERAVAQFYWEARPFSSSVLEIEVGWIITISATEGAVTLIFLSSLLPTIGVSIYLNCPGPAPHCCLLMIPCPAIVIDTVERVEDTPALHAALSVTSDDELQNTIPIALITMVLIRTCTSNIVVEENAEYRYSSLQFQGQDGAMEI